MEPWDLYDKHLNQTGGTIQRGNALPPDHYHLVVHFWIKNKKGEFLIQKRSEKVEYNKGFWSFTGGSALAGENSEQAVAREVQEEIGIIIRPEDLKIIHRYLRRDYWVEVYLLEKDIPLNAFKVGEEVETVKYVPQSTILQMKSEGLFWNLDENYLKKLW